MATFNRTEYHRQYYLRNKEKLDQKRLDNYHKNRALKTFNEYARNHLDEDMVVVRDELVKIDENDPSQREKCIALMGIAKLLLVMKSVVVGDDVVEIEKFKSIQIPSH
jgi:hypothetical protein